MIRSRRVAMLRAYLDAAMAHARIERLDGDEGYYGEIPGLDGLWASAPTAEACREELASALEDWVVAGLQLGHELPPMDGLALSAPRIA
jgi:predicted RNase H-like HicB family nuclease